MLLLMLLTKRIFGMNITYTNELTLPFIIMRDFNEIASVNDKKKGGAIPSSNRFSRLLDLKAKISCIEIPFLGSQFTWRRKTHGSDNILKRLDYGFASIEWLDIFPKALITIHIFSSSYHYPISLSFIDTTNFKAPPF